MVYAEITLINAAELIMVFIQEQLDLSFIEKRKAVMAGGSVKEYDVARPIMIKFANRTLPAMLLCCREIMNLCPVLFLWKKWM